MAELTDRGDDIQAELMLGQDHPALLLGPDRHAGPPAGAVAAATDLEAEADRPVEGGDGAAGLVGGPRQLRRTRGRCTSGPVDQPRGSAGGGRSVGPSVSSWGGSVPGLTDGRVPIKMVLPPEEKGVDDEQAFGPFAGRVRTKVHIAVDGLGNPVNFILTAGQEADVTQAEPLIRSHRAGTYSSTRRTTATRSWGREGRGRSGDPAEEDRKLAP